jgi:phenylalanyl-tRNA synthetase beta chain
MKVSYNWLKEYLDFNTEPERLGEILTAIGLEVEGMEEVESIKGGLKGVVVGHVLTKEKHSGADRLSVTTVDIGGEVPLQIVCGAPNVDAGQKVVIATIGTTLYSGDGEPWTIKKGKIRGELSEGMICAEDELQLGSGHDGIIVLPEDIPVGMAAAEYYEVGSDFIYEIGLTPNRSDATSHLGVAKDLLAYFRFHDNESLQLKMPELSELETIEQNLAIDVVIEDEAACPRYSGVCFSNIKVGPSPKWMAERLESIGVRSINNIVDITNYILHEFGQPLHAFDYDQINGAGIIVKKLEEGTKFTTLDEVERELSADDLMICDGEKTPLCIGGVFGGIGTGVTDETTNIFLESAHFEAVGIRKSSTNHLLRTDAAKVFEKGSDPNVTLTSLERATYLLKKYAGAQIASETIDIYRKPIAPAIVNLDLAYINKLIGANMSEEIVERIFKAMDMTFEKEDSSYTVHIPTNKSDVTRPADVVEEILRIYGMDTVAIADHHAYSVSHENFGTTHDKRERIAEFLVGRGFNEIMGLSLMASEHFDTLEGRVLINNTSNVNLNVMRPSMILSALESASYNLNRQQTNLRWFEFGRDYNMVEGQYVENDRLVILMSGEMGSESWRRSEKREVDFFDIKAEALGLLSHIGIEGYQMTESKTEAFDYGLSLHRGPGELGFVGKVSKSWLKKFGIKQDIFACIFDWKKMSKAGFKPLKVQEISKYPSVRRDLALVIDEKVHYSEAAAIAEKIGGKMLKKVDLFDVYRDSRLGDGKKSYAIKLIFSDNTKTLKDKDVDKVVNKMIHQFESQLGAQIRR